MWVELRLSGLPRSALHDTSDLLFDLGAAGLREDWMPGAAPPPAQPWDAPRPDPEPDPLVLTAWFEDPDQERIRMATRDLPAECHWAPLEDVDWSAIGQQGFEPVRISDRLVVAAPWNAPPGALLIEPGIGFGTGHHTTTRQALRAVDQLSEAPHHTMLDIGCGSGVLALAAARFGLVAHGVDIEPEAVERARAHAVLNGLDVAFDTTPVNRLSTPHDLVVANLHAEAVAHLAADLRRLTSHTLVVAGILAEKESGVHAALAPLVLRHREHEGDWVCLWFRHP